MALLPLLACDPDAVEDDVLDDDEHIDAVTAVDGSLEHIPEAIDARLVAGGPEGPPVDEPPAPPDADHDDASQLEQPPPHPPREGHLWIRSAGELIEAPYWIEDGIVHLTDDAGIGTIDSVFGGDLETAALGAFDIGTRWPNGIMRYEIASGTGGFEDVVADQIRGVLDDLEAITPLRFEEVDSGDRVLYQPWNNDSAGRSDAVGLDTNRVVQNIWLPGRPIGCQAPPNDTITCQPEGQWTRRNSLIAHETLHAAGLFHEAQRPDRDDFVTYGGDSCVAANAAGNFAILGNELPLGPYDVSSLMHYSGNAFCASATDINGNNFCTCTPLIDDDTNQPTAPLWTGCQANDGPECWYSDMDVQGIHAIYGDFHEEADVASYDYAGWALATGDFNGDGYDDLASASVLGDGDDGEVLVYTGSHGIADASWTTSEPGLVPWRVLRQTGVLDDPEPWDMFGYALAAADFDQDGFDDLAVGAIGEDEGGAVFVYRGTREGLEPWQKLTVTNTLAGISQPAAQYGYALTTIDLGHDGRPELVVGAPNDRLNDQATRCGSVYVLELVDDAFTFRNRYVPAGNACQTGADVGASLASGYTLDFDNDPEIAVGAPGHDGNRGRVYLFEIDEPGFVQPTRTLDQRTATSCNAGMGGYALGEEPREAGDRFGEAVAIGHRYFQGVLVVGSPGEDGDNGRVDSFAYDGCFKREGSFQEEGLGANETGDRFGAALHVARVDGDNVGDLLVGAPGEGIGRDQVRAGWVYAYRGTLTDWQPWTQFGQSTGPWTNETGENFGKAIVVGDFDKSTPEVVVAAPRARVDGQNYAGAAFMFRGDGSQRPRAWRRLDADSKAAYAP